MRFFTLKRAVEPTTCWSNMFRSVKNSLSWVPFMSGSTEREMAHWGAKGWDVCRVLTALFGFCRCMQTFPLHLPVKAMLQIIRWGLTQWVAVLHLLSPSWYVKMFEWHLEEEEPSCTCFFFVLCRGWERENYFFYFYSLLPPCSWNVVVILSFTTHC